MLGHGALATGYSRRPLQVDRLTNAPVSGVNNFGTGDGARRSWSADPQPYYVGCVFNANADHGPASVSYDKSTKAVTLTAPAGGQCWVDGYFVPAIEARWVKTGRPVGFVPGSFPVGTDPQILTATLDTTSPNYDATGDLSVSFKVIQAPDAYLGEVPLTIHQATLAGAPLILADVDTALSTRVLAGGERELTSAIGNPGKGDAVVATLTVNGADSANLPLPLVYLGRQVIGVVSAYDTLANASLAIATMTLGVSQNTLVMSQSVINGTPIRVALALGGRIANTRPGNRELGEFAESLLVDFTVATDATGAQADFRMALADTRPGLALMNRVLKGVMSVSYDPTKPNVTSAYVNGRLYPATVTGLDRNLVTVTLTLSPVEYALLGAYQNDWESTPQGGLHHLAKSKAFVIRLPILWSDAPQSFETAELIYDFKPLCFLPAVPGESYELAHRGRMLIGNSSIANVWQNQFSPLAERLPLLHGKRKGAGQSDPGVTFADVLDLGQDGEMPFEGLHFALDGALKFQAGVFDAESGYAVWGCLVKVGRALRLFFYIVEGDTFDVSDNARAFVSFPLTHAAE